MADACHSPSFLKKITELPMRILPLPSSFVKAHGKLLKSDVILEGPSRKLWKVVVDSSSASSNVTFGRGWEEFVVAHVLQLGDQLRFTLTANSHFQVEVYDESGCQKTSALDATGFHASAPRRLSELQIPPPVSESNSAATRVPQFQNLDDDPTLNLAIYNNKAGEKPLNDIPSFPRRSSAFHNPKPDATTATRRPSQIQNLDDDPTLNLAMFNNKAGDEKPRSSDLRRESALASIRRDSARKGSAVRDPYVFLPTNRNLVPDSLLDLADCFVDMEKILSERPNLTDTEPLVIEDIPPCWELHDGEHHTPPLDLASSTSSAEKEISAKRRISTLFASRPPDLQIPKTSGVSKIGTHETTSGSEEQQNTTPKQRESLLLRSSALQIPTSVLESEEESSSSTKTPMRLSQIRNLDDPTLKAEELALYTKVAAEKALSELQLESAAGSPLSRRESSIFKAQSFSK